MRTRELRRPIVFYRVRCSILILMIKTVRCSIRSFILFVRCSNVRCSIPNCTLITTICGFRFVLAKFLDHLVKIPQRSTVRNVVEQL